MPVESATYVNQLNVSNPPASDGLAQADDHLRLLKAALLATFPNLNSAANCTPTEMNQLAAANRTLGLANGTVGVPSVYFDSDTDLGFFRFAANQMKIAGRLLGQGALPVGHVSMFAHQVPGLGTASGAGFEWLELNGALYLRADYPDLAVLYGVAYGGDGVTTFGVPNMKDTGRFPRSRSGTFDFGVAHANQNAAHTHTAGTLAADSGGAHTHTGTTDSSGAHNHTVSMSSVASMQAGASSVILPTASTATSTDGAHTHTFTTASGGAHTHTVSGSTASSGAAEARPDAFTLLFAVKT